MKLTRNAIYDYTVKEIQKYSGSVSCSAVYEPVIAVFPNAYIAEITAPEDSRSVTLDGDDSQRISTFEVQVTSNKENGSLTEAYAILDVVNNAFKKLKFIRIMQSYVPRDDGTTRVIARYRRFIGGNETINIE